MSQMYDASTLGTANNQITFNDYTAKPIFRVRHTKPTRREIREQDSPIPESSGVADFESWEGKSYYLVEGTMYAATEAEFYRGRHLLQKLANLELQQSDPLSDNGYVPYTWYEAGNPRTLWLKVMYIDRMDETTGKGYTQDFTLMCKVKYPYIVNPTAVTGTIGLESQGVPSGGVGYPFSYPVLYGATTYASNGTVINEGDAPAYPAFNIYGPINVPRITNVTTGEYIEVNTNLNTVSDVLSISYDQDTAPAIRLNGVSVFNLKNNGSTFFKIKPGANELQLTGASTSGGYATISLYSSWPIS